jgi:copper chaperone NosL
MTKRYITTLAILIYLLMGGMACAQGNAHAAYNRDSLSSPGNKCPVCGMYTSMFTDWNAHIHFKDATTAVFDGAKDMFKYYLDVKRYDPQRNRNDMVAVSVKDYYSKTSINAFQAYFVIWSDIYGPMGHEPIPFEKLADAKRFLGEHKGRGIISFQDVNPELIASLDDPP